MSPKFNLDFRFIRNVHNRRPILWTVVSFITVVVMAVTLSVWWNVLLVQNHRILTSMTKAAQDAANNPAQVNLPLALLMVLGLLCTLVIVLGLVYLFLRLIRTLQLNLAQNQFISSVTHELRSPVASLQIMIETIRDPSTPEEKRREFEACMEADINRLKNTVDQILDTTRLENLFSKAALEPLSLEELLTQCIQAFDAQTRINGAKISLTGVSPDLRIKANRLLFSSAINSILENAFKYSGQTPEIEIHAREAQASAIIEVKDNGIGIAPREQKKIFKRFYRASDTMTQGKPGTGLGLYFAKLAVLAQKGKISVESPGIGQGSTLRIEIPKAN